MLVLVVQAVVGNPYVALLVMAATALPGIAVALRLPDARQATAAQVPVSAKEPRA